ncbi:MAG: SDR family NAD(P)-dependent oxidoreductase [Gammaproteobacteria bacterium]|nr:SDR family NAD(P)-dependent oxidoreductase [Gammaproteobacteria bacterium]NVK88904.1 SDR family NAD(P)-dependent oxidoreductase [Gammaproteobacteria bacterium]
MSGSVGKRVLITGVTSGIGEQLALRFLQQGHQVYGVARSVEKLQAMQQQYANFKPLACDLASSDAWQSIVDAIEGDIEIVVLNAGNCEYLDNGQIDIGLVRRVFELNFFTNIEAARMLLERWSTKIQRFAVVSSSAGFFPLARAEAYGASKAAVSYFFSTLRLSYPTIKFSLIHPGFVETPLTDKNDFDMPMKISAAKAADVMYQGILKGKRRIDFPRFFILILKCLSILPDTVKFYLGKKMVRK